MTPEDSLLVGVALVIVVNRTFTATGLPGSRAAFATVQAIDIAACLALFLLRFDSFPSQLDSAVRLFLTGVVTWHMVLNYQFRQNWLRNAELDRRRAEERADGVRQEQLENQATGESSD